MKYLLYILIVVTLFSCKKERVQVYQGKDGISFFGLTYQLLTDIPVRSYSFALQATQKTRDTLFIPMRITGKVSDKPRVVLLKTTDGTTATAGVDFELKEAIFPAGATTFNYPLVLINSTGMANNVYRIVLEPAETKDFTLGTFGQTPGTTNADITEENFRYLKVDVTGQYIEPSYWSDLDFGEFSAVKYQFMVKTLGITDFSYDNIGQEGLLNFPVTLKNALAAYEAVNGPLIDENGERVTFSQL